jgi:hypothetical protein
MVVEEIRFKVEKCKKYLLQKLVLFSYHSFHTPEVGISLCLQFIHLCHWVKLVTIFVFIDIKIRGITDITLMYFWQLVIGTIKVVAEFTLEL